MADDLNSDDLRVVKDLCDNGFVDPAEALTCVLGELYAEREAICAVLRALPRCQTCLAPATHGSGVAAVCDDHLLTMQAAELPWARALRRLQRTQEPA